jgi:hypothetical protein
MERGTLGMKGQVKALILNHTGPFLLDMMLWAWQASGQTSVAEEEQLGEAEEVSRPDPSLEQKSQDCWNLKLEPQSYTAVSCSETVGVTHVGL